MNKLEFTLKDYFFASPYHRSTNFKGSLNEDIFFRDYFIEPDEYQIVNQRLEKIFLETASQVPLFVFLYGFSGTGKTTFIHWCSQKAYLQDYNVIFFEFANVLGSQHKSPKINNSQKNNKNAIFDDRFNNLVMQLYNEHKREVCELLRKLVKKYHLIITTFTSEFMDFLDSYDEHINNSNGDVNLLTKAIIRKMCEISSYQDKFLFSLLFYYYNKKCFCKIFNCQFLESKETVFVFDNIDHINIASHNLSFPREIAETHHNCREILHLWGDDFNNITFISCMRDSTYSTINRQLADITPAMKSIFFKPLENEWEMLALRLEKAHDAGINISETKRKYLKKILKDIYTKKSFQPLFNYNIRKLANCIADISTNISNEELNYIINVSGNVNKFIARGVNYFFMIEWLLENDYMKNRMFLENIAIKDGFLNPSRILLTNLHNLCKFTISDYKEIHSNIVGLGQLYSNVLEIFKFMKFPEKSFFNILTDLFIGHNDNWMHLVSFSGKQICDKNCFNEEITLIEESGLNSANLAILDRIKVKITPAGFIYLNDIIKHYEFFSKKAGNTKPLLMCLESNCNAKASGGFEIEYEWEKNIQLTYPETKTCIKSLNEFMKSKTILDFERGNHVFRIYHLDDSDNYLNEYHENSIGHLYMTRIIGTHITYLDNFRIELVNNYPYLEQLVKLTKNNLSIDYFICDINKKILSYIHNYVNLITQIHSIKNLEGLVNLFNYNIDLIKQSEYKNTVITMSSKV